MSTLIDQVIALLQRNKTPFRESKLKEGISLFYLEDTDYHIQVIEDLDLIMWGVIKDGKISFSEYSLEGLAERIFAI